MNAPAPRLILHPLVGTAPECDRDALIRGLREIGLIGEAMDDDDYVVGREFLHFISFLGCSPQVVLAGGSSGCGREGAFVRVPRNTVPRLLADLDARPPRCPVCRKVDPLWQRQWIDEALAEPLCAHCGTASPAANWQWGRGGGWLGLGAQIVGVHPDETVPAGALTEAPARRCGGRWRSFYLLD